MRRLESFKIGRNGGLIEPCWVLMHTQMKSAKSLYCASYLLDMMPSPGVFLRDLLFLGKLLLKVVFSGREQQLHQVTCFWPPHVDPLLASWVPLLHLQMSQLWDTGAGTNLRDLFSRISSRMNERVIKNPPNRCFFFV